MAKSNTTMNYDPEEDILWLSRRRKVKASIVIGDFVIDVDHDGFVTGVEINDASKNLSLKEEQLKSLKEASMTVTYKPNYVYISIFMKFEGKEKDINIPLTVDLGHGSLKTESARFAVA